MDFKVFENYEVEGQISMFECEDGKEEQLVEEEKTTENLTEVLK